MRPLLFDRFEIKYLLEKKKFDIKRTKISGQVSTVKYPNMIFITVALLRNTYLVTDIQHLNITVFCHELSKVNHFDKNYRPKDYSLPLLLPILTIAQKRDMTVSRMKIVSSTKLRSI